VSLLFSTYDISAFTMFVAQVRYLCYNIEWSVFPFLGAACKYLLASFLMTSSVDWGAELNQSVRRIQCVFVTWGLYQKTQEVLLHLPHILNIWKINFLCTAWKWKFHITLYSFHLLSHYWQCFCEILKRRREGSLLYGSEDH